MFAKLSKSLFSKRLFSPLMIYGRTLSTSTLSSSEVELQSSIRSFAQQVIGPKVLEMDRNKAFDPSIIKGLFEHGLMGIEVEDRYGGAGMSFFDSCIVINELARVDPSVSLIVDVQNTLIVTSFRKYGSEYLKSLYLPRLAKHTVGAFCLSEAGSGSDAFSLKCRADRDGDNWIINGTKLWITMFANVDFEKKHRGITAFVVDKSNKGVRVGRREDKLGMRASCTTEIILEDCVVSKESINLLNEGRIGISSQMVGLGWGVWNTIMPYLTSRKQFGQPVSNFQGLQFQFAKARIDLEAAQHMYMNAARLRDAGSPFVMEAAMAKYHCAHTAQNIASQAIDWAGAIGFTEEFMLAKYYRDCKVGSIYEGTSNIQLNTIAKLIINE